MLRKLIERAKILWVFILAASAVPLTYILSLPCGLSCTSCPLTGACLLGYPLIIFGVAATKSFKKIKVAAHRLMKRNV